MFRLVQQHTAVRNTTLSPVPRARQPSSGRIEASQRAFAILDTLAGATVDLGGHQAIKPGQPEASLIIKRITSSDPDEVMPPRGHGKPLSAADVETLSEWIRQGANYALHWSYQKPIRPALPTVKNTTWGHTPLDRFLLRCWLLWAMRISRKKLCRRQRKISYSPWTDASTTRARCSDSLKFRE